MQGNSVVWITRHAPYLSKKQLGMELDYKQSSIGKLIKGFEKEVGRRYSVYAIAENRYNYYAVIDFLKYRQLLEDERTRKYAPPFDPTEIAELCGGSMRRVKG